MDILSDITAIRKIDEKNVLGSIENLSKQCLHAYEEVSKIKIPEDYKNIKNAVFCGMGGSGLGARIIESAFKKELLIPFFRIHTYNLPSFVDENSLVLCSSYSGNTEETTSNYEEAKKRNAKVLVIASGGKLIEYAKSDNIPYYQIDPKYNPSNQPRMAIGYSLIGSLLFASKVNILNIGQEEVKGAVKVMEDMVRNNSVDLPSDAKKLAILMKSKIIVFISAEHLVGATHTVNNQLNENAKNLSFDFEIPELNHHLMEGLKYPSDNKNNILIIMIDSTLYSPRIKERFQITKDVIEKNNIPIYYFEANSNSILSQVFEVIQFQAYANYYLSILYGQNPAPIPWVDYFKQKLG